MSAADVRRAFLDFFAERGHARIASSSLVPGNDPTLLFTNAGMVQFKDVFLGKDKRDYARAVTSQRCVRAGGKHNDLENVGYTARHHTFFEMLGNFSFGDYFKRDAIRFAWDFVTGTLKLDPARLWVTVYKDDQEAADIWIKEIGVSPQRFSRMGEKSNFWAMGDTGPCGPCTEIFYDHGEHIAGGPPGSPDEDGDRYVEIWNLVFMQFDRSPDGTLTPLPKPSVDTGAGLERISAVMQGVTNNYDIDLFRGIVAAAARLAGTEDLSNPSLRVIADHIRACTFLIPFFHKLVAALREQMGEAYPELQQGGSQAARVLLQEEERFAETLSTGMVLLNAAIDALARSSDSRVIDGETVFKLYDTYGFPADLTADVARERGLGIDQAGFEAAMEAQRERARAASRFGVDLRAGAQLDIATEFCGYAGTAGDSTVVALLRDGESVEALRPGERGEVILARTPFYAESGGQVGDAGELHGAAGLRFIVEDTQKRGTAGAHSHIGRLAEGSGGLKVGDRLSAQVDTALRGATALNHSATHLLHAALREVLGAHVQQKGSRVAPDRLRFDFSHFQPVTAEELHRIERRVNEQIRRNAAAETREMSYDDAVAAGATALFGEKYSSTVRVLRIGEFSMELCGGTHVTRAGDIGVFKILSEGGVASGVRRIEAVTGAGAIAEIESGDAVVRELAGLLRGTRDDLAAKVRDALERIRQLEKDNRGLRDKLASGQSTDIASGAVDVDGVKVLATVVDGADAGALRTAVDGLKDRLKAAIIVLASSSADGKVTLVAGVTAAETSRLKAGELVGHVAAQVGGRGGGRADFAQAGGTDASRLPEALASVVPYVRGKWGL
ncbi:MAG: alanine--tRNA ligase [Gammaproteobacteria bacterium]|nr:alanine--tRNA ligase [Gammaproteobacteria bacterium]